MLKTRERERIIREKKKKKKHRPFKYFNDEGSRSISSSRNKRLVSRTSVESQKKAKRVRRLLDETISFLHDFHPFFFFVPLPLPLFHDDPFHSYAPRGRMCPVLELCKVALSSAASYVSWLDF